MILWQQNYWHGHLRAFDSFYDFQDRSLSTPTIYSSSLQMMQLGCIFTKRFYKHNQEDRNLTVQRRVEKQSINLYEKQREVTGSMDIQRNFAIFVSEARISQKMLMKYHKWGL